MANKEYVDLADLSLYKQLWETRRDEIIEDGITNVGSRDIKKLFGFGGYLVAKAPGLQFTEDFRNFTDVLDVGSAQVINITQVDNTYYAFTSSGYVYISSDLNQWTSHQMTFDHSVSSNRTYCNCYYHDGVFYHYENVTRSSGSTVTTDVYIDQSTDGYTWTGTLTNISGISSGGKCEKLIVLHNGNYTYIIAHATNGGSQFKPQSKFCYASLNELNRFYGLTVDGDRSSYSFPDAFVVAENKALFSWSQDSVIEIEISQNGAVTKTSRGIDDSIDCMNNGNEYGFYSKTVYINREAHVMSESIASMVVDEADGAYAFASTSNNIYQLFSNGEVKLVGECNWRPSNSKEPDTKFCLLL